MVCKRSNSAVVATLDDCCLFCTSIAKLLVVYCRFGKYDCWRLYQVRTDFIIVFTVLDLKVRMSHAVQYIRSKSMKMTGYYFVPLHVLVVIKDIGPLSTGTVTEL